MNDSMVSLLMKETLLRLSSTFIFIFFKDNINREPRTSINRQLWRRKQRPTHTEGKKSASVAGKGHIHFNPVFDQSSFSDKFFLSFLIRCVLYILHKETKDPSNSRIRSVCIETGIEWSGARDKGPIRVLPTTRRWRFDFFINGRQW